MTASDKLRNILAFLIILFGEEPAVVNKLMDFSPDYLLEKWQRYVESEEVEFNWGMHPVLRQGIFEPYLQKWGVK